MNLTVPSKSDCELVRIWRNECLESLRTPFELTVEMQEGFYKDVICNRNSIHKYWSVYDGRKFIGFGGITNIQWENSIGEISLIINPKYRRKGYGEKAVDLLFDRAFNHLGLRTVFGECYYSNPEIKFWEKITKKYGGYDSKLPDRKFWQGKWYNAFIFSVNENEFRKLYRPIQ